uniref:Uncharacterized protein n=1 Tax=Acrobeloides nanus TaxID=290746 RepID=A0A914EQ13_9BILA
MSSGSSHTEGYNDDDINSENEGSVQSSGDDEELETVIIKQIEETFENEKQLQQLTEEREIIQRNSEEIKKLGISHENFMKTINHIMDSISRIELEKKKTMKIIKKLKMNKACPDEQKSTTNLEENSISLLLSENPTVTQSYEFQVLYTS